MKQFIFTVIFLFSYCGVFAAETENKITKQFLQNTFFKEFSTFTQVLNQVKTEQFFKEKALISQQNRGDIYYQTILKEIKAAVNKVIEYNKKTISKDFLKKYPDYDQAVKNYERFYNNLNTEKIAAQITAYAKKEFPSIDKIQNLKAACFSDKQLSLSFSYENNSCKIIYQFENGYISHVVSQKR